MAMNALARAGAVCTGLYLGLGGSGWWAVAAESPAPPASEVAQNFAPAKPSSLPASATATSPPIVGQVKWDVLARSVEGRPIEFAQFGDGVHQVLVIGAFEGDKPEGVAMAESLASHLARFPRRLGNVTVTIVRDPNPDGRTRRTSVNARGVELDRNFRTSGWRQAPAGRSVSSGHQPESEPETRAIIELLADLKPERVVLLATIAGRLTVNYAGSSDALARTVARDAEAQIAVVDAAKEPGSLLTLLGHERAIPTVRFGLVPRATADAIWSELKAGLMTAIGCGSPTDFPKTLATSGAGYTKPEPCASPQTDASPTASPSQPSQQIGRLASSPRAVPSPAATVQVSATARPVIGEVAKAAAVGPLQFENIRHGVPNVQVVSPRATTASVATDTAAPATASAAAVNLSEPAASPPTPATPASKVAPTPEIQRLPPVDAIAPPFPRVVPKSLPQAPIPVYPNTGL